MPKGGFFVGMVECLDRGGGVGVEMAGDVGLANGDLRWGEGWRGLEAKLAGFGSGRGGRDEISGGEGVGEGSSARCGAGDDA